MTQPKSRAADATIKGYHYQFDKTILEILRSTNNQPVKVEGLEDVDIHDMGALICIQCKYLKAQKYGDPHLREPLAEMIRSYVARPAGTTPIKFRLYAHFGQGHLPQSIDLQRLQRILRWQPRDTRKQPRDYQAENGWTDQQLNDFLAALSLENAKDYTEQWRELVTAMASAYQAHEREVELHYYSNALHRVITMAGSKDSKLRTVTRSSFLKDTKVDRVLFNIWFQRFLGQKAWLRRQSEEISRHTTRSTDKWIFLDPSNLPLDDPRLDLAAFIKFLVSKSFVLGKSRFGDKPWTVVLEGGPKDTIDAKKALIKNGIRFEDGNEMLEFSFENFTQTPVVEVRDNRKTISRASYIVRLVSSESLSGFTPKYETLLFVSRDKEPSSFFKRPQSSKIYHLAYVMSLDELATIVEKIT